jgi:nucleotide-binding universal stress UspA family protein
MNVDSSILVPVDFDDASNAALAFTHELAARFGMEIVLLHVFTPPIVAYPGFTPVVVAELPAALEAAARGALDKLATDHRIQRTVLRTGDPVTEILAAIDALQPALVAMGAHGRAGIAHALLGGVTERVVRASPVPVLTVRAKSPDA